MNPSLQRNAAIAGLDTVSNIIRQSKVIDEIYAESAEKAKTQASRELTQGFRDMRVKLYSQILEFEARLVCYFSKNKVIQAVRDLIKCDSWDKMVEDINKVDTLTRSDRQIINEEKMNEEFKILESGMQDTLHQLGGISKSIEDNFTMMRRRWEGTAFRTSDL